MEAKKSLFSIIFLTGAVSLALWLRVSGLEWGLPNEVHSNSYMPDENNWISIMAQMEPSRFNLNPHNLAIPTFHFYLVGAGIKMASAFNWINIPAERGNLFTVRYPEEYAKLFLVGRLFSVVMGVMTIWFVYLVGQALYGRTVGIVAALFMAVAPSHIIQSHYFHVNAPVTFWVVLSFYFAIKILNTAKTKWYLLAGITAGLAMSTKYTSLLLLIPLTAAHLLREDKVFTLKDIGVLLLSKKLCFGYSCFLLFFVIGSPYIILSWPDFFSGILYLKLLGFKTSTEIINLIRPAAVIRSGLGLPLSMLSILGLAILITRRRKADILLLTWIVPFYLIACWTVYYATDSRLVPLLPFLLLCAALFLYNITKFQPGGRYLRYIQVTAIAALFAYNLLFSISINRRFHGEDVQDRAGVWIQENIPAGTKVGYETSPYWWAPYIHYSPTDRSLLQRQPLIICEWDKNVLERERPSYFVATDLTFHEISWGVKDWDKYQDFRRYLIKNYQLVKEFTMDFGYNWLLESIETKPDKGPIGDLYYQPIYILKRVKGG